MIVQVETEVTVYQVGDLAVTYYNESEDVLLTVTSGLFSDMGSPERLIVRIKPGVVGND